MIDFNSVRGNGAGSFDFIQIRIASPEEIRGPRDPGERERLELEGSRNWWSWGEVTKPETINYRSFKPEYDGLFCERIFGPVKDWECHCGKYKRILYRGVICDQCGVEVTLSKVRRERMGHIELVVPVTHIWFVRVRRIMPALLDMALPDLEKVIYYSNHVVVTPGNQDVQAKQLLDDDEYAVLRMRAKEQGDTAFLADIGASAVRKLLRRFDVDELAAQLRTQLAVEISQTRRKLLHRRLKIVEAFRNSGDDRGIRNRPDWMTLDAIPVIPPDLRPLVPLDGGRFATSDLNDLYRGVVNRNNRLRKLILHRAPEVILRNEKRMLQEAVDALFDNGRRSRALRGRGKRPLASLSAMLTGKQGRFRQNLLGKRTDYSGRSVIVAGPELQLHQCGLPRVMALELFKPFVVQRLVEDGLAETVKRAKRFAEGLMTISGVDEERETIRHLTRAESHLLDRILDDVVRDRPVLLNRAPTLHRLGIQAFEPVLIAGKAIRVHPLVCAAFNADFDGDQMAVHVPLSFEAQVEARVLMAPPNNILRASDGRPAFAPTQDIVVGCAFATKAPATLESRDPSALRHYTDAAQVETEFAEGRLTNHTAVLFQHRRWELTTVGRVLFNAIMPEGTPFVNAEMDKQALSNLIARIHRQAGASSTAMFLDRLKNFGLENATRSGLSIGIADFDIPAAKSLLIAGARQRVERIEAAYREGLVDDSERRDFARNQWIDAFEALDDEIVAAMESRGDGINPLALIVGSGARGSLAHLRQLAGAKGFVARPEAGVPTAGGALDQPITRSFREGLTPVDYFRSCHGTRKASSDHSIRTAKAGYFTRRLVDAAHAVVITEEDCGTIQSFRVEALTVDGRVLVPLAERIRGSVAGEDVEHPIDRDENGRPELVAGAGVLIDDDVASRIESVGIHAVAIRSVMTCEAVRGVCRQCYGRNPATDMMADIGDAVGIIAAQSAGEPVTQQLLNAKHVGGTASFVRKETGVDPQIVTDVDGTVRFVDLVEGETLEATSDVRTGRSTHTVRRPRRTDRDPRIEIVERGRWRDRVTRTFILPDGARLNAVDGAEVRATAVLATMPTETLALADIARGLARLEALFEARPPAAAATLSEIDGVVRVGGLYKRKREVFVTGTGPDGKEDVRLYQVRGGARLLVQDGDRIGAAQRLSEGPIDPHDVLRIEGPRSVQAHLLNEIQEVYRTQHVVIRDKHVAVIIRQMLQQVRIIDSGETELLDGQHIDRIAYREENDRARCAGRRRAVAEPVLLGLTKASLTTTSFISAASFQEAPRVLADAAVRGARDDLLGLKENVIIGHLIPAGTGIYRHREIDLTIATPEDAEPLTTMAGSFDLTTPSSMVDSDDLAMTSEHPGIRNTSK